MGKSKQTNKATKKTKNKKQKAKNKQANHSTTSDACFCLCRWGGWPREALRRASHSTWPDCRSACSLREHGRRARGGLGGASMLVAGRVKQSLTAAWLAQSATASSVDARRALWRAHQALYLTAGRPVKREVKEAALGSDPSRHAGGSPYDARASLQGAPGWSLPLCPSWRDA